MTKYVGILTAGGDTPGLNSAIRAIGKTALEAYGMQVIGFLDGFRGLMQNRSVPLNGQALSGILTHGGTILGTSRDKPQSMLVGGKILDMTDAVLETYEKHRLDVLVCLGGGGTMKSAYHLMNKGLNIITLPKTIDNDVAMTDVTFGFDTALGIATEVIDRLHSTAHSHHRIIVVELMGHNAGWLALGAGTAGGADVVLIPEIPYDSKIIAQAIQRRSQGGKRFSIVAVSEGAISMQDAARIEAQKQGNEKGKKNKAKDEASPMVLLSPQATNTLRLAGELEQLTGLESRVTILGHVQRGGTPSAGDRLLATRLGTTCADFIQQGKYGVMVAARGDGTEAVPLDQVVGKRKVVPPDHPWIQSAKKVGTCLGN